MQRLFGREIEKINYAMQSLFGREIQKEILDKERQKRNRYPNLQLIILQVNTFKFRDVVPHHEPLSKDSSQLAFSFYLARFSFYCDLLQLAFNLLLAFLQLSFSFPLACLQFVLKQKRKPPNWGRAGFISFYSCGTGLQVLYNALYAFCMFCFCVRVLD